MQHLSPLLRLIRSKANINTDTTPLSTALIDTLGPLKGEISSELIMELIELMSSTASSARHLRNELKAE